MGEVEEVDERETSSTPAWACPARKNCSRNSPSWPRPVRNPSSDQPPYSTLTRDSSETIGRSVVGSMRRLLSDPPGISGQPLTIISMTPSGAPGRILPTDNIRALLATAPPPEAQLFCAFGGRILHDP